MSEDRPIVEKVLYWKLVVFMCVCKCKFIESSFDQSCNFVNLVE